VELGSQWLAERDAGHVVDVTVAPRPAPEMVVVVAREEADHRRHRRVGGPGPQLLHQMGEGRGGIVGGAQCQFEEVAQYDQLRRVGSVAQGPQGVAESAQDR